MDGLKSYNIAVTGLNAGENPGPGIPVARCLKEHKNWSGKIIGLAYDALEPGILDKQIIDKAYLIPYSRLGKVPLLERILQIHKEEKFDLIIPNHDIEVLNFIQIKQELEKNNIKLFLPSENEFAKRSKVNLDNFCNELSLKTLKTKIITSLPEVRLKIEELPVMVKGAYCEAYLASSFDEIVYYVNKISNRWGFPVLIQEYKEGDGFNAVCIGDGKGNTLGTVCMKKLVLTEKGKGWICVSIENSKFLELAKEIISSLKWTGALEIETIYSKVDNSFYLIEINPRFPSWIYLAKEAGINLPYIYLQLSLGHQVSPNGHYKNGVVLTNYTTNIVTELTKIQDLFIHGTINNNGVTSYE